MGDSYYFHQNNPLLYPFLKLLSRLAMFIWCRRIIINKPELLKINGPVLLASNHPNSFLDSIVLDTLFKQPIWSLARGDVFKKPLYIKLLTALKILPVYRTSEGVENIGENYRTFDACMDIFKKNGIITIFSEGKCINEWHLRPLKKGTARLAIKAWEEGIPVKVIPVGINYSSFTRFGKNLFIHFGEPVTLSSEEMNGPDGSRHFAFNNKLNYQLTQLVLEIQQKDKPKQKALLEIQPSMLKKILLALPAAIGYLVHFFLYLPIKKFTWNRTNGIDHYDSVLIAILLVVYPFYLVLLIAVCWIVTQCWWSIFLLLTLPFTAWSYVQLKPQLDK